MKNNFFGYMFILFIIIIMGFAIYKVKIQNEEKNIEKSTTSTSNQDVQKGKEITLAISEFDNINPIITSNKKVQDIDKLIYEPLINITEDYNIEYKLASECAKNANNVYIIIQKHKIVNDKHTVKNDNTRQKHGLKTIVSAQFHRYR